MPNRIISLEEVSNLVGRHPRTIWRWWAKEDGFPAHYSEMAAVLDGVKVILTHGWMNLL